MLTVTLCLLPPLAACILSRIGMYRALTGKYPDWRGFLAVILPGASHDMLFVLCTAALVMPLPELLPDSVFAHGFSVIFMTFIAMAAVLLNCADAVIYSQTHRRFFYSLLRELRPRNIMMAASASQRKALAGLVLCAGAYGTLLFFMPHPSFGAALVCLGLAVFLCTAGVLLRRTDVDVFSMTASSCSWNIVRVVERTSERLETIRQSAFRNAFTCLKHGWLERNSQIRSMEYTPGEKDILRKISLLGKGTYAAKKPDQRLYKRIILICLELVGRKMLPFYNARIPVETMPFLQTLLGAHPRLDNFCTAHTPTNQGLHALLSSRMAYEYDMRNGAGRIDSLASLLREVGYATFFVSGVTRHYGDWELFAKSLLRYEYFLSEESIRALYPAPQSLHWGIADKVLYDQALTLLDSCRNVPVLLTMHTMNTHPGFFHSLEENAFPECIRRTSSNLLRSLFEVDRDIMTFFKGLGQRKLFDGETLVVITADHSPSFAPEYLEFSGADDYTPDLIPCVFVTGKGGASPFAAIRPDTACSQLDFLPTLIDAFGLRRPDCLMGRSLFCGLDNPVISQFSHDLRIKAKNADCFVNIAPGNDLGDAEFLRKWYTNNLLAPYRAT